MDLIDLATRYGLPIAMMLLALWSGLKRIWVWGYQLDEHHAHCEEIMKNRDEQLLEQKKETEYYRSSLMKILMVHAELATTTRRAVQAVEKRAQNE